MEQKTLETKKEEVQKKSSLSQIVLSGLVGGIIGGIAGTVDSISDSNTFSSPVIPLGYGGFVLANSKKSKELGDFQGVMNGVGAFSGYITGYHIIKNLVNYFK